MSSHAPDQDVNDEHRYGRFYNEIFYILPKKNIDGLDSQKKLIKDFFELLNNKKIYEQQIRTQEMNRKTVQEMNEAQTFTPKLAPKTSRINRSQMRDQLSQKQYIKKLYMRSREKSLKIENLRQECIDKELMNCTFQPRTNHKDVSTKVKYKWFV